MKIMGRPTSYTPEIAEAICLRIADGESLRHIAKDEGMPSAITVHRWVIEDREGFAAQYERARFCMVYAMADEMLEIASGTLLVATGAPGTGEASAKVQAKKLEVETRKWLLSKLMPKDFGDRLALEHSGPEGGPIQTEGQHTLTPADEAMIHRIAEARERVKRESSPPDDDSDAEEGATG